MNTKQQPLALMLADRLHHEQPMVLRIDAEHAGEELLRQHARITELEAQLEAVGAGGVGPLIADAGFDAADMATAAAQGFRDGVASVAHQPITDTNTASGAADKVLAYLDDLSDDAAAHIFPSDLAKCMTSECVVEVVSVRAGNPNERTVPLFSREQVVAALASTQAQPVAEPAPSATAHVGDSLFESWFSEYNPALRGTKQLMRDAYAAGMDDGKVAPLPGTAYAALPEPLEIDWPELHSQALGCGVEDRDLHNRYECAEYGWQDGVDKCAERVPEQIFDADQMLAFADATCALRPSNGQAPAGANENAKLVTLIAKCRDAFPIPVHGDPIENYWSAAIEDPANVPAYLQEIAKRKQAGSVQDDSARLDWLLLRVSGAEFRRIGVHYSGNARRADVDAARKQGENHD